MDDDIPLVNNGGCTNGVGIPGIRFADLVLLLLCRAPCPLHVKTSFLGRASGGRGEVVNWHGGFLVPNRPSSLFGYAWLSHGAYKRGSTEEPPSPTALVCVLLLFWKQGSKMDPSQHQSQIVIRVEPLD